MNIYSKIRNKYLKMPRGNKSVGIFNDSKVLLIDCGASFTGTKKAIQIKNRLHVKKCPICIKKSIKPLSKSDIENTDRKETIKIQTNFCYNKYNSFVSNADKIREYVKYKENILSNELKN